MPITNSFTRKQLISDPVAALSSKQGSIDDTTKQALQALSEKIAVLRKQHKNTKHQCKIISRQIGEAKNIGQACDDLMQKMQSLSLDTKDLARQCSQLEDELLSFFEDAESLSQNETNQSHSATGNNDVSLNIDEITITQLTKQHDEWNAYVDSHESATIHHQTHWIEIYSKTYGLTSHYFLAKNKNGECVGVLPLSRLSSRLFGDMLVSMPYFQHGGAVADNNAIEEKLISTANNYAKSAGVKHIEYRDDIPRNNMPVLSHKANMVLTLPDSHDSLWQSFSAKLRAQIKRPQKVSPQVIIDGKELLDEFYQVYTHNMRDLGSPAHSKALIKNILENFPQNSWLIVIRHRNQAVSAALLLGHGNTMEIPLASTLRKANPLSMNMLLYWEVLQFAILQGYSYFDFGRSTRDAGTYRFKRQWGAQPKQLHWHYWLADGIEMPSLNPSNPKYKLVISIWKRLPVFITRWLGPAIVKNIP